MSKPTKETRGPAANGLRLLPQGFSPSINEVVIGRGRKVVNHSGNQRFQDLIQSQLREYSKAKSKTSKSAIILRVLMAVKNGSPADVGGFVKQNARTKRWYALEDASARISTAQAFRDALSGSYRSSKQYKQQRRWNLKGPCISSSSSSVGSAEAVSDPVPASTGSSASAPTSTAGSSDSKLEAKGNEGGGTLSALLPSPEPKGDLAGLRGILDSAIRGLMDDDLLFLQDFDAGACATPECAWSFGAPQTTKKEDHLSALLDRFENQVEWTENPYEPTPLSLRNRMEASAQDPLKPAVARSSIEPIFSLRDALTCSVEI